RKATRRARSTGSRPRRCSGSIATAKASRPPAGAGTSTGRDRRSPSCPSPGTFSWARRDTRRGAGPTRSSTAGGSTGALPSTAAREIPVRDYRAFLAAHPELRHTDASKPAPGADQPITNVTWYEAVQYCRWLSEQEGIPEDQMCYPGVAEIEKWKSTTPSPLQ